MPDSETKEAWVEKYARRIFELWQNWQGPLGVSGEYIGHLKEELGRQYEDQLKRSMVELNYPTDRGQ
jgi:hypothetical protein